MRPVPLRLVWPESDEAGPAFWRIVLRELRPHQWVKNALLFVPLALAHQLGEPARWLSLAAALVAYSACASAVYVLNDLADLSADRRHPQKQHRPIASGAISTSQALALAASAAAFGFSLAFALSPAFAGMLLLYVILTTVYSSALKRTLVLDVLVLAALYTHRLLCGGIVGGVEVSHWLMSFSMFFFMSLALLKRFVELRRREAAGVENRRGYLPDDAAMVQNLGLAGGYLSVLVLCLYISSNAVAEHYSRPGALWLIAPALLYWISRTWLLARRDAIDEDPVLAAVKDPASYVVGAICVACLVVGSL